MTAQGMTAANVPEIPEIPENVPNGDAQLSRNPRPLCRREGETGSRNGKAEGLAADVLEQIVRYIAAQAPVISDAGYISVWLDVNLLDAARAAVAAAKQSDTPAE